MTFSCFLYFLVSLYLSNWSFITFIVTNEKEEGNLLSFIHVYARHLGSAMVDDRGSIAYFSIGSQNLLYLLGSHWFPETTLDQGDTSPLKWGSGSCISEPSTGDSFAYQFEKFWYWDTLKESLPLTVEGFLRLRLGEVMRLVEKKNKGRRTGWPWHLISQAHCFTVLAVHFNHLGLCSSRMLSIGISWELVQSATIQLQSGPSDCESTF